MQLARGFTTGETRLAYEVLGSGPDVLVVTPPWFSHLDYDWATPELRAFYEALAHGRKLVRYDKRGTGLSERTVEPDDSFPDMEMRDCLAVLDAAGQTRVSILAMSGGGPMAIALAAHHPERVDKLILYGTYARWSNGAGHTIGQPEERAKALISLIRSEWGLGSRVLADVFIPEADAARIAWFTTYQRVAATAEVAIAFLEECFTVDVRDLLPQISCPVLVLQRRQDRAIAFAQAEYLAAHIPNATLCAQEGEHHLPFFGDTASFVSAVNRFLGSPGANGRPLSQREQEVLKLVADGLSTRGIAARLCVSEATVTRHLANTFAKIGVTNRAAAVAYAFRHGMM